MGLTARFRALVVAIVLGSASGCEAAGICPLTPGSVETGTFTGLGEDTVVFTGYAIRYVDAPDNADARGYDLNIVRWLKGSASPEGTFLRVAGEVAGIRAGQPVMIIGEPTEGGIVIIPGTCVPLIPITDEEVEGRS